MTAPSYQSHTESNDSTAATTHNVSMPATVNADDLLIAVITDLHPTNDINLGTTPTSWEILEARRADFGGGLVGLFTVYGKDADGTEGGTLVDFPTDAAATMAAQVHRITGWAGTLGTDVASAQANGSNSNPDPPPLTPSWGSADTLWQALYGGIDDDETKSADPTFYTDDGNQVSGGGTNAGCEVGSAHRANTTTTENPAVFTLSEGEAWTAFTVGIEPAAAGGFVPYPSPRYTLTGGMQPLGGGL